MKNRSLSRFLKPSHLNYEFVERFFVLFLSILLIILNFNFKEEQENIRNEIVDFFSPLNIIFMFPGDKVRELKYWTDSIMNLKEINTNLKTEINQKNVLLSELYQLKVENEELKKLLNVQAPPAVKKIVSRIILDPSDIYSSKVFIDVGLSQNVRINSPVFNENGLLGRIIKVNKNTSEVLLIIDSKSSLPVMTEKNKVKFFVEGNFNSLNIKHLPENSDLNENELVISTDVSGYFKQGIVVGKVKKKKDGKSYIEPSARKTDSVYVMTVFYELSKKHPQVK